MSTSWTALSRGSLRGRLLVLVVVPLSMSAVSVGTTVATARDEVASATRAERAVRNLTALSTARTALVQEIMPAFAQVIVQDPALAQASGFDAAAARELGALTEFQMGLTQKGTDSALAKVPAASAAGEVASQVRQELTLLRAGVAASDVAAPTAAAFTTLGNLYDGYDRLSHVLLRREQVELASALADAVDSDMLRALSDLQLVSSASQAGSAELPLFMGTRVPLGADEADNRRSWLTYWGAYRFSRSQLVGLTTPAVRQAWEQVREMPAVAAYESVTDEAVGAGTDARGLTLAQGVALQSDSAARDKALRGVLRVASDQVRDGAAAGRVRAQDELRNAMVLGGSTGLLALALVALISRSVTRPLRRLAQDATDISRGRLVEVEQTGPREVRTAAQALRATVHALQRVEDQASAVARGELQEVTEQEPLPGPLGDTVHQSLVSIVAAIHQREELQSQLSHQAAHDQLTSLPNRAQALRLVAGALHRAQRAGTAMAVLFVDLDHFKQVNDTHGHASGDSVLRAVAGRMENLVRSGDVVCRLGGDEFVVLVEPADDDTRSLLDLAERIIAGLAAHRGRRPPARGGCLRRHRRQPRRPDRRRAPAGRGRRRCLPRQGRGARARGAVRRGAAPRAG